MIFALSQWVAASALAGGLERHNSPHQPLRPLDDGDQAPAIEEQTDAVFRTVSTAAGSESFSPKPTLESWSQFSGGQLRQSLVPGGRRAVSASVTPPRPPAPNCSRTLPLEEYEKLPPPLPRGVGVDDVQRVELCPKKAEGAVQIDMPFWTETWELLWRLLPSNRRASA